MTDHTQIKGTAPCNPVAQEHEAARKITAVLRQARFPTSSEVEMQNAIAEHLENSGIEFAREFSLAPSDRIDFFADGCVGIEVKTRCARRTIYRQMARYAENPQIEALILVTGTFTGLPETLNNKPVYMVANGRSAL